MTGASWQVLAGDCRDVLRQLPERSVHTVVTSPPYFGLRDYGASEQIGLEATPDEFVEAIVAVFREVRRVLRDDGTAWLNLGDSYARAGGPGGGTKASSLNGSSKRHGDYVGGRTRAGRVRAHDLKDKDLIGIPWMVAFALRADGWFLRSEIIWHKPNPLPESVTDRPTKAHEQLFLLSKRPRYFYDADAIREEDSGQDYPRTVLEGQPSLEPSNGVMSPHRGLRTANGRDGLGRNKRSVWTVSTVPFAGAHFATFPPKLIEPCILAGAPERACSACGLPYKRLLEGGGGTYEQRKALGGGGPQNMVVGEHPGSHRGTHPDGFTHDLTPAPRRTVGFAPACDCDAPVAPGVVLDPFTGAGTTALVALRLDRSFVGCELNPEYVELARERIIADAPLLNMAAEASPGVAAA